MRHLWGEVFATLHWAWPTLLAVLMILGIGLACSFRSASHHRPAATCDRGPTLVLNAEYTTTGHVLHTSTQIPSFLDANLMWDPLSGTGFECHISGNAATTTALGDTITAAGGFSGMHAT